MRLTALIVVGVLLAACQPPAGAPKADPAPVEAPKAAPAAKTAGVYTQTGLVTKVEDGGYPMFVLTVDFGGGDVEMIRWNNEEATLTGAESIEALQGKRAEIGFVRSEELNVLSISHQGKELLSRANDMPKDAPAPAPETILTVTGTLSGAEGITRSDLPDELMITEASGAKHVFEHYISERPLIAANGKTVEAKFETDLTARATSATLAPAN